MYGSLDPGVSSADKGGANEFGNNLCVVGRRQAINRPTRGEVQVRARFAAYFNFNSNLLNSLLYLSAYLTQRAKVARPDHHAYCCRWNTCTIVRCYCRVNQPDVNPAHTFLFPTCPFPPASMTTDTDSSGNSSPLSSLPSSRSSSPLSWPSSSPSPPPEMRRANPYPSPPASQTTSHRNSPTPDGMDASATTDKDGPPPAKRRRTSKERTTEYLDLRDADVQLDQQPQLDRLLHVLHKRRKIVVITGAGISVSAGSKLRAQPEIIPTLLANDASQFLISAPLLVYSEVSGRSTNSKARASISSTHLCTKMTRQHPHSMTWLAQCHD